MAQINSIAMSTNLDEWTSMVSDDCAWTASGLAGTIGGLLVTIDDQVATDMVKNFASNASGKYRVRFYIDPNTLTMALNDIFTIFNCYPTPAANALFAIRLNKNATDYRINQYMFTDVGDVDGGYYTITDAPHYVECYLQRAATNISADGSLSLWIDGVLKQTLSGKDNYDYFPNIANINLGAISGIDAGTTGTFLLDELVDNDDGGIIGPRVSTSDLGAKAFGYQFPTLGETGVSWTTLDDGAAGAITVSGDADWGKMELDIGEQGRSAVYDLGDVAARTFTLTENRYGSGSGTATLQYRTDTSAFVQDDILPAWTTYTVPFAVSCRYVQIREIKSS